MPFACSGTMAVGCLAVNLVSGNSGNVVDGTERSRGMQQGQSIELL